MTTVLYADFKNYFAKIISIQAHEVFHSRDFFLKHAKADEICLNLIFYISKSKK